MWGFLGPITSHDYVFGRANKTWTFVVRGLRTTSGKFGKHSLELRSILKSIMYWKKIDCFLRSRWCTGSTMEIFLHSCKLFNGTWMCVPMRGDDFFIRGGHQRGWLDPATKQFLFQDFVRGSCHALQVLTRALQFLVLQEEGQNFFRNLRSKHLQYKGS